MENSKINPHKYTQLIFDKRFKKCNGTKIVFPTNGTVTAVQKKMRKMNVHIQKDESKHRPYTPHKRTQTGSNTYM